MSPSPVPRSTSNIQRNEHLCAAFICSSLANMSRPSTPIYVSSRDSTPSPPPIDNLSLAQLTTSIEESRLFFQDRLANLDDETMNALRRSVAHAAIIAHWAAMFNAPVSETLQAFATAPSVALPLLQSDAASTPPLMIPPPDTEQELAEVNAALATMVDLPGPNREPITPTDPVPSMPSSPPPFLQDGPMDAAPQYTPPQPDEVMNALIRHDIEAAVSTLEREDEDRQRTPSPTGPQPNVHPGPGWFTNFEDPGYRYVFNIPNAEGRREIAVFVQIDWNPTNPELLGTLGRSCPVYARSLHARPDDVPRPAFDLRQEFFFADGQLHTEGVDWAIEQENDDTIKAEVMRHRAARAQVVRRARQLADLREQLADDRFSLRQTTRRLAKANAYRRLRRHITHTLSPTTSPLNSRHIHRIKEAVDSPWNWTDEQLSDQCTWCAKEGHRVESCALLRICQLCVTRGHLEENCYQPHHRCTSFLPCHVPLTHQYRHRHACPSTVVLERN